MQKKIVILVCLSLLCFLLHQSDAQFDFFEKSPFKDLGSPFSKLGEVAKDGLEGFTKVIQDQTKKLMGDLPGQGKDASDTDSGMSPDLQDPKEESDDQAEEAA